MRRVGTGCWGHPPSHPPPGYLQAQGRCEDTAPAGHQGVPPDQQRAPAHPLDRHTLQRKGALGERPGTGRQWAGPSGGSRCGVEGGAEAVIASHDEDIINFPEDLGHPTSFSFLISKGGVKAW